MAKNKDDFSQIIKKGKKKKKRTMFRMLGTDQLNHFETNQGIINKY